MKDINHAILIKLKEYESDVFDLSNKALELAGNSIPEQSIVEQLESLAREIIRKKRRKE